VNNQQEDRQIKSYYNTVIIGGGINGIGIFRDLALHGVDTLLCDAYDFCSQTSQSSSKMLHGGIRYLETLDFDLISEALQEKSTWLKLAPGHCYEQDFYLPTYKDSKYPLPALWFGLKFYDALSKYKNSSSYTIGRKKTISLFPTLKQESLRGSGVYYDAIVDDIKLGLDCLWDALEEPNASAINYLELIRFEKDNDYKLFLRDKLTNTVHEVYCKNLSFATGPFTDKLMDQLKVDHWKKLLVPNKGIHLWLKPESINISKPMVLRSRDDRMVFVIPQRNKILVGTTEHLIEKVEFNNTASQQEVTYLLGVLNSYFPKSQVAQNSILSTFAGIRPLVLEPNQKDISKISRKHIVVRPFENCYALLGGKYTTFRVMAQDVAKPIVQSNRRSYNSNLTLNPLRRVSAHNSFDLQTITKELIEKIVATEKVTSFDDLLVRRLANNSFSHLTSEEKAILEKYKIK
jgi:glycerol-3-phosphate dehydrogenase